MGFVFNFITYGGHQIDGLAAEEFTTALREDGMLALARLQRKFRLVESPYRTPQTLVGGPRADAALMAVSGQTATTKAMGAGSTQSQHLVQTEVPPKLLTELARDLGRPHGVPGPLRATLRPLSSGSELLELSVADPSEEKLANVVFATIQDRRGRLDPVGTRPEHLRRIAAPQATHDTDAVFLIHRYKAAAIHYLTPTEDNHRQCESMQRLGIFERTSDEVGQIIVADVNTSTVSDLVQPTSDAREGLEQGIQIGTGDHTFGSSSSGPGRRGHVHGPCRRPARPERPFGCLLAVSTSTRSRMNDHNPAPAPAAVATELAGYPQHWEADVLLVDGGVVHLRPSGTADGAAIRAMHGRMSARTLFLRYFTPLTEVTDEQVALFTDTDYVSRVGLVAELGGEVIAAGTYHRNITGDPDAAEVAFVVEDSQQRRGLGSILLEHLAAAAQERGIRRFTAEVLSENRQMVRVFIDAGYQVNREYGSGIVDLVFDIEPTEKSRAVVTSREHRAESRSIARLLSPRSIAVIGASSEPTKIGHAVLLQPAARRLRRCGVPGESGRRVGAGRARLWFGPRYPRTGRSGGGGGAGRQGRRGCPSPAARRGSTAWS